MRKEAKKRKFRNCWSHSIEESEMNWC